MPPYESLPYRPCAGMMVLNRDGLVFIGRRSSGPEHIDATYVWQMPKGGIDEAVPADCVLDEVDGAGHAVISQYSDRLSV